ncbi:M9 family metallopeptidase [Kitasatospora phosalacinea]|uniref:microbial collagenase n=1 Tax=Kitasatospora phosalacinea TaxID=2065 RepID=A0A9W6PDT0_9ACTN|nr:collagenase [Kitasatospora phosalacinea]GLW53087.1 protease [Kitasatospora phosalacinea]
MRHIRISMAQLGRVFALAFALVLTIGLFSPQGSAFAAPTPSGTGAPTGTSAGTPAGTSADPAAHPVPKSPDEPADNRPTPGEVDTGSGTGSAPQKASRSGSPAKAVKKLGSLAADANGCDTALFGSTGGDALVKAVESASLDCLGKLYDITGTDAGNTFREPQMVAVADALRTASASYDGTDSGSVAQLVAFLRAGYYVQWYNTDAVGSYGSALQGSIRGALDAFHSAPHAKDVTEANGQILSEAVVLIDSAQENARYTGVVKDLLNRYTPAWTGGMWSAVSHTRLILENGLGDDAFNAALAADPAVADSLASFVKRNSSMITGGDLATGLGIDLGAFLEQPVLRAQARPLVKELVNAFPLVGATGPLTMNLAWFTEKRDEGHCSYYGLCDLPTRLAPLVLTVDRVCSPTLHIRAQALSADELDGTCSSLANEDALFHSVVKDGGPVADDVNTSLEVVVYDSSYDYRLYAWSMFDIDVDNGGMYLEGEPSEPGNQARFIAHEAEWLRPAFSIWNLNHEYAHYLDGRFDFHGDFDAGQSVPNIWWIEGFAEYMSYTYRDVSYDDAIAQAALGTYELSTLFDTTYENTDQTRTYNWGYLAVRYLLQSHPQDVAAYLARTRTGDYTGARAVVTGIGTSYDADFAKYLAACGAGDCGTLQPAAAPLCTDQDTRRYEQGCRRDGVSATTGNYSYNFLNLPAGVKQLTITTSGGTGNADLYWNPGNWATTGSYAAKSTGTGNGETLTVTDPPAGWVYFSLHAQDGFSGVTVTTQY